MSRPIIVIAEDAFTWRTLWRNDLAAKVDIKFATTVAELRQHLTNHPDAVLLVINGALDSQHTYGLMPEIKSRFTGHILATARTPYSRKQLMALGCTHESSKLELPAKVLEVLGLT